MCTHYYSTMGNVVLTWFGGPQDGGPIEVDVQAVTDGLLHIIDKGGNKQPSEWRHYVAPIVEGNKVIWYAMREVTPE